VDEPTIAERLRDLQSDVQRILSAMGTYVTQEQRNADQVIQELKLAAVAKDQAEDRARLDTLRNWVWSAVIGPVIVGTVLYFLLGGKS